jgi:hypothetical protein
VITERTACPSRVPRSTLRRIDPSGSHGLSILVGSENTGAWADAGSARGAAGAAPPASAATAAVATATSPIARPNLGRLVVTSAASSSLGTPATLPPWQ